MQESNDNATGGYLDEQGPYELLVRSVGRLQTTDEIDEIVVKIRDGRTGIDQPIGTRDRRAASQTWRQRGFCPARTVFLVAVLP